MIIASSAIILKDKKILLVKRLNDPSVLYPSHWACPGGREKPNESPEEVVIREVKEEVNLDFNPTKLFSTGKYKDRILYRFLGKWSGHIRIQKKELTDWKWFSYEDAIELDLAFDYESIIQKLHNEGYL